ncbi:MAG: protein TonB [Methylophilaceae bacterium]
MELSINNHRLDGNGIIWAITASMLLHVLVAVIAPNFGFSSEPKKPQLLKIELQQLAPAAHAAEPLPPIDIPELPKPIQEKPKAVVKPKSIKKQAPIHVEQAKVTPQDIIAVQPTVEEVAEVIGPPTPLEPPPPPPPPASSQADINSAKDAYGRLLGRAIAKHKSYPKIAQRRGWQGTALLDLKIDSDGNVILMNVRESSGYEALDKRALAMVKKASPFPAPPKALQGRSFNITVPVSFKLANG